MGAGERVGEPDFICPLVSIVVVVVLSVVVVVVVVTVLFVCTQNQHTRPRKKLVLLFPGGEAPALTSLSSRRYTWITADFMSI